MKTSKNIDVSLILTGYNEGKNLPKKLKQVKAVLENTRYSWEIILIDDKSRDSTPKIFADFAKRNKNVRVYFNQINIGRGGTVMVGMKAAYGRVVGYTDTDLEILPVHIPDFIKGIDDGSDMVIGRRYYNVATSLIIRLVCSWGYAFLMRKLLGLKFLDTEAGIKFFNRKKILPVLNKVEDKRYFFDTEIVARSYLAGLKIIEKPVIYIRDSEKQTSVNLVRDIPLYFYRLWNFRKEMK